jgi:hypothetical protein
MWWVSGRRGTEEGSILGAPMPCDPARAGGFGSDRGCGGRRKVDDRGGYVHTRFHVLYDVSGWDRGAHLVAVVRGVIFPKS